jgi:hypothetical protein
MQSRCLFVLASYGTGRGRGVPVGGASYESESERGRDVPSSLPRTSRTLYAVEVSCLCCGSIVLFFIIVGCGYPHTVGTDNFDIKFIFIRAHMKKVMN